MRTAPCVVQTSADMPIGVAEYRRIEIADYDDRIRTRLYLSSHYSRLIVTQTYRAFPFGFQTPERGHETLVIALRLRFADVIRSETVGL